jgi:hypothetical protein
VYKILKDAASDFHYLDNLEDRDKDVAISLADRNAKLCSGMRHEEYADEAPLLKVVI